MMAHTCQKCMVRKPSGGFQSMGVRPKSSNQGLGAASVGGSGRVLHRGTRHRGTWVSLEDATIFGKRERDIYIIYNILYIYIYGIPRGLVGFRSRSGSDHYAMDQEQRNNLFLKVCAPRLIDAGWLQPPFFGMGLMPRKFCFPQLG